MVRNVISKCSDDPCVSMLAITGVVPQPPLFSDSPRVAIEGENKTLTMGEALSVTCMIDANPTNISKVEWYLNNDVINLKDERIVNEISETSDTVTLTIESVIPKDSGRYKCLVENIAGWSISTEDFTLDVLCKYD